MAFIYKQNEVAIFKALAHPERLKIIDFLKGGPRCVCELNDKTKFSQSNLSQHLKILRDAGIVDFEKEGNKVIYYVKDPRVFKILEILK
jgi:DNA-binding transcriptional ArsR family regulator